MYKILIDFETRSACDLKKHGAWIYSRHPSTSILCMGYIIAEKDKILISNVTSNFSDDKILSFIEKNIKQIQFVAHNAFFEQSIYYNILVKKFNWPVPDYSQWKCTMAKSMAHALPRSLDNVCQVLGLQHQKDMKGHRLMLKLSQPRKPTKTNPAIWHERPEEIAYLKEYCLSDIKAEFELENKVRDLSPYEQNVWLLDQKINMRGVYVDTELAEKSLKIIDYYLEPLDKEISDLTQGIIQSPTQASAIMKWCNQRLPENLQLEELRKETLPDYIIKNKELLPVEVLKVLEIRVKTSKTSNAKFSSFINFTDLDGRARGSLLYHGAATGRWAGSGIQPQNLPKGLTGLNTTEIIEDIKNISSSSDIEKLKEKGDLLSLLSSCIRGCIVAAPGKILLCGDYASIEARVLMFEAQETQALDIFTKGEDIYCDMATSIYNRQITKVDKDERFLGKTAILGLGYTMGREKFKITCASQGVEISDELATKVVKAYRSKYLKVVKFWKDIERAAINAIKTGQAYDVNNIRYKKIGNFLYCRLPSGRLLSYFKPSVFTAQNYFGLQDQIHYVGMNSQTNKFKPLQTYGGKLVENICQGIARDIMAHAMLNLDNQGYDVILTVHDEVVCEVDVDSDKTLDEFLKIIATPPIWAKDCPLAVEGWQGERYHK